jgi:PTS system mannose-specific IIA component
MVGIIIVSHGSLASEFVETSKMIVGDQPNIMPIRLDPSEGLEDIKNSVEQAYQKINDSGDGVLVLADLQGGTPCNGAFMMLGKNNISIVSGVNLPMVLEVLISRNGKLLKELTDIAVQSGKEGIRDISEFFNSKNDFNRAESNKFN